MSLIGLNNGPTMESGASWRRHAWRRARSTLLPTLPIEVLRLRVRRAAEIGLDYKTYASIRAASGHDVVAFLFSTNALRLLPGHGAPALPEDRARHLARLDAGRAALTRAPLTPEAVLALAPGLIDRASPGPRPFAGWGETRTALRAALAQGTWPSDGVVLIGDTAEERQWAAAGKLAFYLPAERYFAA